MSKWVKRALWVWGAWRLFGPIVDPRFPPPQTNPLRLKGQTVFVGDQELVVRDTGQPDGRLIVLLHGLGGSSLAEWYKVVPLLASRFRLILIDLPNHGRSDHFRSRFEIEDLADDVAGVLDALGIDEAAVAGYSMGGAVAQVFAHRYPGRVSKLMLVATLTHHPEPHRTLRTLASTVVRAWERLTGVGTAEVRAAYLRLVGAVAPVHARWSWLETHRRDPDTGALATQAMLRFDSRDWAGKLEQPVLMVIPSRDQLVPPGWQYQAAGEFRDVAIVEVVGARHEVPWTHPERLAAAIVAFLEG